MTELILVLLLLGLALGIASSPLVRAYGSTVTRTAVDELVSSHALARSTAVRYGGMGRLRIDAGNARFWVEVDTSGAGNMDTIGPVRRFADRDVTITSDRSVLCFDARGLPTTQGDCEAGDAMVIFEAKGESDTVQTTALGKVLR